MSNRRVFALTLVLAASLPGTARSIWHWEAAPKVDFIELSQKVDAAHAAGDYEAALESLGPLQESLEIRHIEALYNTAALHARLGHVEESHRWLDRALEAGFWDFGHLRRDEDFAALREDPAFERKWRAAWAKQYIAMLEREERDGFQMPDEIMAALALSPGERVADVGAGSGYFTVRFAEAVGPSGRVLATDIRQEMLDFLQNRLHENAIENVDLLLTQKDDPMLEEGAFDTIVLVDVWHYIRDPQFAQKLAKGLAPGGRIVVIDYRPKPFEERPWGPPPVQQTPRDEVDAHFAEAGLTPAGEFDFLPEQYFVVYRAE